MAAVLPCLMLVDATDGRFRYRLVGTEVVANAGYDFTGRYLDELNFVNRDFYLGCYQGIQRSAAPAFGFDRWAYADGRSGVSEFGMFPLTSGGTSVSQLLTIEDNAAVSR